MSEPSFTLLHSIQPKHTSLTRSTAESIRKAIMDGLFPSGAQLPPEFELTKMLGVSRTTLREAIKLLEEMGLIVRRRGLGTFVSNLSITKELSSNFGTATMIKQAGKAPGNQMLEIAITLADSEVAGELGIPEKSPVISLERVRTADQQPVVWSLDYIPADIVDCNELKESLQHWNSLYDALQGRFGINIVRGTAQLKPVAASTTASERLAVKKNTPLMWVQQTDYDSAERAIIYSIEYHVPDFFVFTINRKGPHI